MAVPVWPCEIKAGPRLVVADRDTFARYMRGLEGKACELVLREVFRQRTLDQNAYWWAEPVPKVAEAMGEDHDGAHYALLCECWGSHWNEKVGQWIPNKGGSSGLSVEEFSHMIEWVGPWAFHKFNGLRILLPNEVDL